MDRGFLAGISWGALVGVLMLLVSSQLLERQQLSFPKPEPTEVEVPAGSEFDQAKVETDPVLPDSSPDPKPEAVVGIIAPEEAVEAPPAFDTSSLDIPVPSIEAPESLGETPVIAEDPPDAPVLQPDENNAESDAVELGQPEVPGGAPETASEAPVQAEAAPVETEGAVEAPVEDAAPNVVSELNQPETPAAPSNFGGSEAPEAPEAQVSDTTAPETDVSPELAPEISSDAPSKPKIADTPTNTDPVITTDAPAPSTAGVQRPDGEDSKFFQPVESLGSGTGEKVAALPSIRRAGSEGAEEDDPQAAGSNEAAPARDPSLPALEQFALDFDAPSDVARISVVLVDTSDGLSPTELSALPKAIGIGIDASIDDAATRASAYRDAGREVILVPSLPKGATPQDVEQALRVNFERVPEAVALMDASGSSFQSDRSAVQQVVDVVSGTGHGLITFPRGLNTAHQTAEKRGVPTGLIFRNIDGNNEAGPQIRRSLDRAAFRARQSAGVILVGTTSATTIGALNEWSAGNDSSEVVIAPVSAALLGR